MSLKVSGEKKLSKLGPFGSEKGGRAFDLGAHSAITQIEISYKHWCICSIQIEYDDNGSSVWSEKVGSRNVDSDTRVDKIKLDYPNEVLVSVRGRLNNRLWFPTFVCSITFRSNKNTYGPYGSGDEPSLGPHFSFYEPGNMIVGFHGRISLWDYMAIRAIGAYLKPIDRHSQNRNSKSSKDFFESVPLRIKRDDDDNEDIKQVITVAGNQVMGNEGKDIGSFVVGNKINYHITQYYSEKFSM